MSKIVQGNFQILANKKVGVDYFKMEVGAPSVVKQARPGQFVHVRCRNSIEPLLRRPFSFHRLKRSSFEILYKVIGQGTNLLAKKRKGDKIDILGPLGNGFQLSSINYQLSTILVAGGMGVAPLLALAEAGVGKRSCPVLIGARTKREVLCAKDFKKLGAKVRIATDDGSLGYRGLVTDLLKKLLLSTKNCQLSTIYACGPKPMLQEITRLAKNFRIPAYGSLEENMACGVGACLGCAIKTKQGYKQVCKDGPVFNLQEIQC
ncbi:MAG: dihydroorotate dehydrogenase electron transfer subunit [Omnitrophica bacterium]|nr:dihydroorotate dehydrogenase electron transfer subunit [Candidatus Omnitrophota bacterium]